MLFRSTTATMMPSRITILLFAALLALPSMAFVSKTHLMTHATGRRMQRTSPSMEVKVTANDGEPLESLLKRFKREVNKSGHMIELKHRRYFEDSQDIKKRKIQEARRRVKMMRMARRRKNFHGAQPNVAAPRVRKEAEKASA